VCNKKNVVLFYIDDPYESTCESTTEDDLDFIQKKSNISLFVSDNISKKKLLENEVLWPIGLESKMIDNQYLTEHFLTQVERSDSMKRNKILCNAHLAYYQHPKSGLGPDRMNMSKALYEKSKNIDFWHTKKDRKMCFDEMISYYAELCPEGNGIDTHRFYEAFALGEIPIVRKGIYEKVYKEFPGTILVDEWHDVLDLEQTSFEQPLNSIERLEYIKLSYWLYKVLRNRCRIVTFFTSKLCNEWKNLAISLERLELLDLMIVYVLDDDAKNCVEQFTSQVEIRTNFMSTTDKGGDFGSDAFNQIMKKKLEIIKEVVSEGFFTFYLDTDIVVMKNIIRDYFSLPPKSLYIQSDLPNFSSKIYARMSNLCAGCMFFSPSETSIQILKKALNVFPTCKHLDDQCAINKVLMANPSWYDVLDQRKYINGARYFQNPTQSLSCIWLIHNNWIKGVENKEQRFIKHNLWFV